MKWSCNSFLYANEINPFIRGIAFFIKKVTPVQRLVQAQQRLNNGAFNVDGMHDIPEGDRLLLLSVLGPLVIVAAFFKNE